jgi:hypothetical protein
MSILSNTLLVKIEDNKYEVHVFGGGFIFPDTIPNAAKERGTTSFKLLNDSVRKWEKEYPAEAVVGEEETVLIADANNCVKGNEGKPGFHKYAGDMILMIDRTTKKAYWRKHDRERTKPGEWEEM